MKSLRNLVLAGTIAIAGALSGGAANATTALEIGAPTATESSITQAYYPGGYYQKSYLCYVPFFKLVQWVGFWRAKMIKARCYRPYYPYYGGY
jgi:hypothetical protein